MQNIEPPCGPYYAIAPGAEYENPMKVLIVGDNAVGMRAANKQLKKPG